MFGMSDCLEIFYGSLEKDVGNVLELVGLDNLELDIVDRVILVILN